MRIICAFILFGFAAPAHAWQGTVEQIVDGDTLVLKTPSCEAFKIRLYGIDCPEDGQEGGEEAIATVAALTREQAFEVEERGRDRYGRTVAVLRQAGGATLQESLLRAGAAWVAPRYCKLPECGSWQTIEEAARQEGRGLWHYPQPMPPWEWRKRTR